MWNQFLKAWTFRLFDRTVFHALVISWIPIHSQPTEIGLVARLDYDTVFAKISNELFLLLLSWQHLVAWTHFSLESVPLCLTQALSGFSLFWHRLFCSVSVVVPPLLLLCHALIFLWILTSVLCHSAHLGDLIHMQGFYSPYTDDS